MPDKKPKAYDWDARSPRVQADQIAAYDAMRARCPVALGRSGYISVFKHADVVRVLNDPETFSNAVSHHLSVPNGMDPPEHTAYRAAIDPFFTPERMRAFTPVCERIARERVAAALADVDTTDSMATLAWPFAVHVQCAFMGWPAELDDYLLAWTRKNHAATMALDADAAGAVAAEFDALVRGQLAQRRAAGAAAPDDVTTRLLRTHVHGRPLTDAEIVSVARNWTMGELSTIAASVGIVLHHLATHAALQETLRATPKLLDATIDEILRLHGPLVLNRRRVTRTVTLGDKTLHAGDRIAVLWPSANRDEDVFLDSHELRIDRDPAHNLLYGAGIHVCPGAPLARLELRLLFERLFTATGGWTLAPGAATTPAHYPASGFAQLHLRITMR